MPPSEQPAAEPEELAAEPEQPAAEPVQPHQTAVEISVAADHHAPVAVSFDERDQQLLTRLEEAARYNRRTLAAEILFRLDRTFDETA